MAKLFSSFFCFRNLFLAISSPNIFIRIAQKSGEKNYNKIDFNHNIKLTSYYKTKT